MTAVAHRLLAGALAGAEPRFLGHGRLVLDRRESRALVRAVAERLRLRTPASAPPIALAGFNIDRNRPAAADLWQRLAHFRSPHITYRKLAPPPSVASQAAPQALASSRTRKM